MSILPGHGVILVVASKYYRLFEYFHGGRRDIPLQGDRFEAVYSLSGTSKNRRFQPATVSSGLKSSGLPVL